MDNLALPASKPTLKRLPKFYQYLTKLRAAGRSNISCTEIAREFRLDPTQVRKDLAITGSVGRPRIGFDVVTTLKSIESYLGWDNANDAFLVGAGHLGAALLGYEGFAQNGVNILAAFDCDPAKIGTTIHDKPVYDMEKLFDLASRMHIQIGVLTVPGGAAQEVANMMVLAGIKAIWNLTPVWLDVPDEIIVENVELSASLSVLSSRLAEALRN